MPVGSESGHIDRRIFAGRVLSGPDVCITGTHQVRIPTRTSAQPAPNKTHSQNSSAARAPQTRPAPREAEFGRGVAIHGGPGTGACQRSAGSRVRQHARKRKLRTRARSLCRALTTAADDARRHVRAAPRSTPEAPPRAEKRQATRPG